MEILIKMIVTKIGVFLAILIVSKDGFQNLKFKSDTAPFIMNVSGNKESLS